jgi:hypothetical protein
MIQDTKMLSCSYDLSITTDDFADSISPVPRGKFRDLSGSLVVQCGEIISFFPSRQGPVEPIPIVSGLKILPGVAPSTLGPFESGVGHAEGKAQHTLNLKCQTQFGIRAPSIRAKPYPIGSFMEFLKIIHSLLQICVVSEYANPFHEFVLHGVTDLKHVFMSSPT